MVLPPPSPATATISVKPNSADMAPPLVSTPVVPILTPESCLAEIFAQLFCAYFVALEAHWNVTGAQFFELHRFFRKEYERLFEAIDATAEMRRALGDRVALNFEFVIDSEATANASGMVNDLLVALNELEDSIAAGRGIVGPAEQAFLDELSNENRKSRWMLRSYLDGHTTTP